MTEPSDGIMQRARHIAFPHDDDLVLVLGIARAIMEAIAAEREQCAKVARVGWLKSARSVIGDADREDELCEEIAAAIRARGK